MEEMRKIRKQRKLSMRQLGEMVGMAEATISNYEKGKREPDLATLVKLADALDVSLDMLIRGKEKEPPQTERLESDVVDAIAELPPEHQKIALAVLAALQSQQGE